ncbi:MAG: branched-chain amino acid ABC transporter permease [Dehalococcoidia bacterium]|jgi:branched-chain amino acid transport system permease protein
MDQFIQQFATGLSTGSLYAIIALALVLIYRSTGIVNFAQGEMAMFMTFVAWSIWNMNGNFWLAFFITLVIAGAFGALIELTIIRPVETGPVLNPVIVTLGLFTVIESFALRIWQGEPKFFPTPGAFKGAPLKLGPAAISRTNIGVFCMALVIMLLIYFFFNYTKLGLAMRATAQNRVAGRLVGIRVGRMLAMGWALSSMVGAVAGMLLAPVLFLSPSMMVGVLLFAFAAAVLGGLDSPVGAIVGGLTIGVVQNMAGTYIPNGSSIDITVAFVVIIAVLLVRPHGIFGRKVVQRV